MGRIIKKLFNKVWLTIKLRIEQEEIIFRYALYCKKGTFSKILLITRPLIVLLSILFILFSIFTKQLTIASGSNIHIIFWISYLALLSNYMWKTGSSKEIINRSKWTILALFLLQVLSLSNIAISQTRIRATRPNINISLSTQPGRIFSYTQKKSAQVVANGIQASRGIQIAGAGNLSYSLPQSITVQETQEALLSETDTGPARMLESPLNYPNPFSLRRDGGTEIGFRMSKAVEVEVRVYDTFANEIFRDTMTTNDANKYSTILLNSTSFGVADLSSGIYYYVVIYEGKVLGKGKMAVIP